MKHAALVFATLSTLYGCSGLPAPSQPEPAPIQGSLAAPAAARAKTLYVASAQDPGRLVSLPATSNGTVAPATLVYGSKAPIADSYFVALDASGRTWQTNCRNGSAPGEIVAFARDANGNVAPAVTIGGAQTALSHCETGIAIDKTGAIYVADRSGTANAPGGDVAVWGAGAHGDVAPVRSIAGKLAGLNAPTGVAVRGSDLYVADSCFGSGCAGDVRVFAANANGNVAPLRVISGSKTGIAEPWGVALDLAGNLYVANGATSTITVYAPGANGNVEPIRTIAGAKTSLRFPSGIAVDGKGYVYVGNTDAVYVRYWDVLVFAPLAKGNVRPVQSIAIDTPSIAQPSGIAVR